MINKIKQKLIKIPNKPGVYLFYNSKKELIYVGKASSLKNRVRSYFLKKHSTRPIEIMAHEIQDIKHNVVDSVLEAIILEGNLIKKYRPKYNILWKDDKSWNYITINKDAYPKVDTIRERELKVLSEVQIKNNYRVIFGPYPGLNIKETIKILRKIFNISFCSSNSKRPCFYRQIGECLGVCTNDISVSDYRKKVINPLIIFLSGKKNKLILQTKKEMFASSQKHDFEESARLRDRLKALKRIHDIALLNESFFKDKKADDQEKFKVKRIEGYDISNFGASGKVGVMVVFDIDGPIKTGYRKFNINSVEGQSDIGCLKEVILRRFKNNDWTFPDIILVDGGKAQINAIKKIIEQKNLNIPIVGIAKGPKRLKNDFYWLTQSSKAIMWIEKNKNLLIRVRDEAHRFAIAFQRQKRKIKNSK